MLDTAAPQLYGIRLGTNGGMRMECLGGLPNWEEEEGRKGDWAEEPTEAGVGG